MNMKLVVRLFLLVVVLLLAPGCATPAATGPVVAPAVTQGPALPPVEATLVAATTAEVTVAVSEALPADPATTTAAPVVDLVGTQVAEGIAATQAAQANIDAAVAETVAAQAAALSPTASPIPPTATPPPTATALPSATPCRLELTAGLNAFVRLGPGTNYDALGVLQNGESAAIIGRPPDTMRADWWVIDFGGHTGWISASVVTLNTCPAASLPPTVVPLLSPTPTAIPTATPLPPTATPMRVVVISLLDLAPQSTWVTGQLLADGHNTRRTTSILYGDGGGSSGSVSTASRKLEDGTTRMATRTHPMWVDYGTIKGRFPWVILPGNAVFEAEVGFMADARRSDGVTFWVWEHHYENGREVWNPVARVEKDFDGRLIPLRIDLSHLAGQSVAIELRVDAGSSSGQDWAVWVAPRITGN